MRASIRVAVGAAMAALVSTGDAALASFCAGSNDVCFRWGAPEAAISSRSGNVYFQLRAPTSYQWFALGTGSSMRGSSMFVVYQDGNNNVTLSTRGGQGHVMPQHASRTNVELLEGSGIVNGSMVANVRCSGCADIDFSSSSPWISAWKRGASLASSSPSRSISYHDGHAEFSVNLQQANINSDSNPFLSTSNNGNGGGDNGVAVQQGTNENRVLLTAHGVIMAIVFVVGYPIGSSLIPLIGKWFVHAGWQLAVFLGMWAAFGIGYTVASRYGTFFMNSHTRLGVIVCAFMGLQPILGWLHHQHFVKRQSRGVVSHIHIWYGRMLMILGIVNGGLGLHYANESANFIIAYAVVAGVVAILYASSITLGVSKRRKARSTEKHIDSPSVSEVARQQSA
ncbi:hypothetical protein QQS21_001511 [Conoideocrella luteorostrata]|uniref:DOMON domain-containing protein n=1 Tax=Conoideocrella luteorostrata TaxID=1105319 RepID=A0AAJ0CWR3_9HYPO|nr:hypothetical protein QQS21_001511 [Conoideocrella luteorostrata]